MDFLKQFPFVTKEEYLWEWSVPQVRLASHDSTHVHYLSEKEQKKKNATIVDSADDLLKSLGYDINKVGILKS